jgi:phage virion morphogenesis protein
LDTSGGAAFLIHRAAIFYLGSEVYMSAVIEINTSEIEKLAQMLNSYVLSGDQRKSLLHDIGVEAKEQTLDRFDLEEDPKGNPWKKLADATVKYKNKISSGGILERGGYLKKTLSVRDKDENSVLVGAVMEYAGYHQMGTPKLPARPYFGLSMDNISDLAHLAERWLNHHVG